MASYISAARLASALERLGNSRAKRTPLFDFLIVKRALALKGEETVPITENEPAFVQALDELAGCGEVNGQEPRPGHPYLNFFATTEKGKHGYRPAKYRSNGTNTNIAGTRWPPVITLTDSRPRQARLTPGYEDKLAGLVLGSNEKAPLPNLTDVAAWYFRGQNVESLLADADGAANKLNVLTQEFKRRVGLTPEEVDAVFDAEVGVHEPADTPVFVDEEPSALDYLPAIGAGVSGHSESGDSRLSLDLVVALAAKNFVILTGPSGTGKSRSALKLAEAIQARFSDQVQSSLFELIPVGPDWTSPKRLLGFKTPFGKERQSAGGQKTHESYEITDCVRLILRAAHPDAAEIPHFLIFDEMNLSHVERYFAPFLSLMEAASILEDEGGVSLIDSESVTVLNEILQLNEPDSPEAESALMLLNESRSFVVPPNLFFIGTVNVDETTYMFSPKVLDRAHVIELGSERPSCYLRSGVVPSGASLIGIELASQLLQDAMKDRGRRAAELSNPADVLDGLSVCGLAAEDIDMLKSVVIRALDGCYDLLSPAGFPFGYRVSKEVFVYLYSWGMGRYQLDDDGQSIVARWHEGLDRAILQKVLPKIHGNKRVLGDSLKAVASFLNGGHSGSEEPASYTVGMGQVVSIHEKDSLSFPAPEGRPHLSIKKLLDMHNRLSSVGYVSFVS